MAMAGERGSPRGEISIDRHLHCIEAASAQKSELIRNQGAFRHEAAGIAESAPQQGRLRKRATVGHLAEPEHDDVDIAEERRQGFDLLVGVDVDPDEPLELGRPKLALGDEAGRGDGPPSRRRRRHRVVERRVAFQD